MWGLKEMVSGFCGNDGFGGNSFWVCEISGSFGRWLRRIKRGCNEVEKMRSDRKRSISTPTKHYKQNL